ncbi:MAG: GatB/YqeY domain-containing protein [Chloroflexota bacterium]|nr:GatB/YqeY domain-containing protein [Chloroflexota bacterium]
MSLLDRISGDLTSAQRGRDQPRVRLLRTLRSAIAYEAKDKQQDADDDLVRAVLAREARRREEAIKLYESGGRADKAAEEQAELAVIATFLPPVIDTEAIETAARAVIDETGASGPSDMGRVMGPLMARLRDQGTVDGKAVSATVRALLSDS